jgi:hypothetical protein
MAFRIAIIYEDNKVFLEFTPEKFKELLERFGKNAKKVTDAVDRGVEEIKKELSTK